MKKLLFALATAVCALAYENPTDEVLSAINANEYYAAKFEDGIGARWDGRQLAGRKYAQFQAPASFSAHWPKFAMRGVLSCGTDYYDALRDVSTAEYDCVKFYVYELPDQSGDLNQRLEPLRRWLSAHKDSNIRIIEPREFATRDELEDFFDDTVRAGAEGIVLSRKGSKYVPGGEDNYLVVRKFFKDSCTITGLKRSENGEFAGYECEWHTSLGYRAAKLARERERLGLLGLSARIEITDGLSAEHRQHPLAVGTQIGFRYSKLDAEGKPSRPFFLRDF